MAQSSHWRGTATTDALAFGVSVDAVRKGVAMLTKAGLITSTGDSAEVITAPHIAERVELEVPACRLRLPQRVDLRANRGHGGANRGHGAGRLFIWPD